MAVRRASNQIELYRARAALEDISELSGRGSAVYKSKFIARRILEQVNITEGSRIMDVGCGDGTFIIEAASTGVEAEFIGILPTEEEVERVCERISNWRQGKGSAIEINQGKVDRLIAENGSVDTLVCNSVLFVACADLNEIEDAIQEFARVVRSGGTIFLGEMPDRDDSQGGNYGNTWFTYLRGILRHQGFKNFGRESMRMIRGGLSNQPYLYTTQSKSFCSPQELESMLGRYGITVLRSERSQTINRKGEAIEVGTVGVTCVGKMHRVDF